MIVPDLVNNFFLVMYNNIISKLFSTWSLSYNMLVSYLHFKVTNKYMFPMPNMCLCITLVKRLYTCFLFISYVAINPRVLFLSRFSASVIASTKSWNESEKGCFDFLLLKMIGLQLAYCRSNLSYRSADYLFYYLFLIIMMCTDKKWHTNTRNVYHCFWLWVNSRIRKVILFQEKHYGCFKVQTQWRSNLE